jgi:hypothetical protein
MTECNKTDCAFDPVEWGEMRKSIKNMEDLLNRTLGNGLVKDVEDLKESRAKLWGGLIVIGVIVPSIIGALIKWL